MSASDSCNIYYWTQICHDEDAYFAPKPVQVKCPARFGRLYKVHGVNQGKWKRIGDYIYCPQCAPFFGK